MQKNDSVCIYCGEPLSKWENIRSYCWDCSELTTSEAFHDDDSDFLHPEINRL
jgi:predicted amidophosphoribosyltransferase